MHTVALTSAELSQVKELVDEIAEEIRTVEDAEFLANVAVYAHRMPEDLRAGLNSFRLREPSSICRISGYEIDDSAIGRTPAHWSQVDTPSPALREEIFFMLCGYLLGEPVGWATQQAGRILHNVVPIKGRETDQVGWGSTVELKWHTEDAFHPYRTDYVALMCMRNPDMTGTTYASSESLSLSDDCVDLLFSPRFVLRPDDSHLEELDPDVLDRTGATTELVERSRTWLQGMIDTPEPVAVLYGDRRQPYMRLDPYYMDAVSGDLEAREALDELFKAIDGSLQQVTLEAGDICFIDNFRAVHGRNPFKPRYDGTDRWLKRLNITRDLRKSRSGRVASDARVIF